MAEVTYHGVYQPLRGVEMSRAYASTLDISFEVRGGLFVRQIHHWAALLFAASIMVHLARIFFTGAFRRPARGQLGDRLAAADPGDVRGLLRLLAARRPAVRHRPARRILVGITMGIPVIGTWLHWALFGGDFPRRCGNDCDRHLIPRLYALHILLIPGIILALIGAHLALVWFQKHTQFPGPGRTETQRRRRARHAGVRGQVRRVLRDDDRHPRPDGRSAADQPDLAARPLQALPDLGGQPARLLHDVDRRPGPSLAGVGVLPVRPHHPAAGVGRGDHGPGVRAADRLSVPGEEVHRGQRAPQPAAASA